MSLPPGFLDELRTRTSLARVVGRKVAWDQRKSNQGKGDLWASCPFHQEKSASFHVDDRQGFYYCFGCHAKGDAISFVRETENVGFMEAVEILAREAGMVMPARDPQAQERADRRTELTEVVEQAVQFYRLQLKTAGAAEARAYLARRGLSEEAQARFGIGWAPDSRQALSQALQARGIAPAQIAAAGLSAEPDGGGAPYDRFRGRIIFPIRDVRGRAISLGGRSMDPAARAKYLNGPETEIFDKGRTLYNHGPAREAAGKGRALVVAEGYMDVIALAEAGFCAVAPLGTAITAEQLALIWRISDEPVICLDGDTAGLRAAMRLIDLALPLLEAGRGLRFATVTGGKDPDELIRASGPEAMQAVLDAARPMVDLLWQRETAGKVFDSPERRAALDRDLRACLKTIADPSIRAHYAERLRELRAELFRPPPRQAAGRFRGPQAPAGPLPSTRASALGAGGETGLREALVLAVVLAHPDLLPEVEPALERMDPGRPDLRALRDALLAHAGGDLREAVARRVGPQALDRLFAERHLAIAPALRPGAGLEDARACLDEELAKLAALRGAVQEVVEATQDIAEMADEGLTWRLREAAEARNRALRAETEDRTEFDIAPSGARISREEKAAFDAVLKGVGKPRRSP
jgi:DNA primase